ncbi:mucin-2-like [Neodiprion pinetum]|uniref:Mucin-2-like n=1 Tax=Neodiprion lecontei TaxID=441921 RepID=A0ABM3FF27_NEOLC|nr:mucin-2-like [Neodiprion lecontei]
MENKQQRIPALMTLRLTRPTTITTNTERTPLLQTPGQAPHPHRYGRDGTHRTETRRTLLPTPTTHTQVTKTATTVTHTTTIAPTTAQRHSQTHTTMTTHTITPSGPRQCPKCNGLVRGTKYTEHIQTCTQTNTDTPHPPQTITHPPTVIHTTRTTATHTTTHPPTKKQTPHTTTRPTPTPTPRYTPPPTPTPQWTHTRFARPPQKTEDRILQTFANMDRHTESTQTKQTCKQYTGPPPEIIAIIASLVPASTLHDELRAHKERYMTRRAHERTDTDETEASTSTHQPHTTHQTAPHKTQPHNTPDTDSDTDSTTSTAETVIHIETTHTGTLQTQTTDNDTDSNTDTTSLTDTVEHTQTPQPATHTTRDSKRYKKRKSIRKQKKEQNRKH